MSRVRLIRKSLGLPFAEVGGRLEAPFAGGRAKGAVKIMRFGQGSFEDQFRRQQTLEGRGARSWEPTKPFGTRPATRPTLQKTGKYRQAWLGGTGNRTTVNPRQILIGVDPSRFPQEKVFQRRTITKYKVKPKQRVFLGIRYGVWLKPGHVIANRPRALRINEIMKNRMRRYLVRAIASGDASAGVPRG